MADTIFALATPPGRSGIAVVRISGPAALGCAEALGAGRAPERLATLRRLRDPRDGGVLDDALVLRFAGPRSFTGEDVVELQLHGGPAVCRAVTAALGSLDGLRLAEPGEFTRRALLNGKIDLAQAEGVGDLLVAETAAQARQARVLVDGALSASAGAWRDGLVGSLARIEASIDFADEDVPADALDHARRTLDDVARRLAAEIAGSGAAERLRFGFEVALVGAPNVGKSTLLNRLAGREAAITSVIAGTTRDAIEVRLEVEGLPVTVVDTAGLRDTDDPLEAMGVARARRRADDADLRVFLLEDVPGSCENGVAMRPGDQVVFAKADLRSSSGAPAVSGVTGEGVPELLARIAAELSERVAGAGLVGRERQRVAVERALASVSAAIDALGAAPPSAEVAAAEIQVALRALDFLVGKVDVEAVLDVVFRSFCIGK